MTIPFFLLNHLFILIFGFHHLFSLYVSLCLSISPSISLSVYLSIYLSLCPSASLSVYKSPWPCLSLFLSFPSSLIQHYIFFFFFHPTFLFWFSFYVSLSFFFSILGNKIHKRNKNKHSPGCARNKILQLNIHCRATFTRFEWGVSKKISTEEEILKISRRKILCSILPF